MTTPRVTGTVQGPAAPVARLAAEPHPAGVEQPPASYAGRTRFTELEYEAILANASLGIAFTRDRKFFLCNPKFGEMFGWDAADLIGQSGDLVYASRESYEALGRIAGPILASGEQLEVEWEMRRRDGTLFPCRAIAKAIDPLNPGQGTIWITEDITQRKRQAAELDRLLSEHAAILDTASIGISFIRERRIVRCNRRFEQMHGYAPGEMIGRSTRLQYASEEDYRVIGAAYGELAQGHTVTREVRCVRNDGVAFWARASGRYADPADPAKGSVWVLEDVTEQRQAIEEIQRLLKRQNAILHNAMIGIAFLRDRRIVSCNRRFEEIYGYDEDELIGCSTRVLYPDEESFASIGELYKEVWRGATQISERQHLRKDGSLFWCRISGRALEPGDPSQGSVWLADDITAQHEAEARVGRALAEQQLILDNATVGIAFVRERVIQRASRSLEQMAGVGPGELVGRSTRVLYASQQEWDQAGHHIYRTVGKDGIYAGERRFARSDGSIFLCRMRGRRISRGDGYGEWIWSYEDITLEREAEARVQRVLGEQQLILDYATVGIAFQRQRRFQLCNPQMERMFGYAQGELLGKSTRALYGSEEDFEEQGRFLGAQLLGGKPYTGERAYRRKDGGLLWCRVVGKAIDPNEPREGSIWIYEDITTEHEAQEKVRRVLAEQELILDNATVGIAFVRQRIFQRCNPRCDEMFGYSPGGLAGESAAVVSGGAAEFERQGEEAYRVLAGGATFVAEQELIRRDGNRLWCKVIGRAVDPANPHEGSIWIYEDVSTERAVREALVASRDALERAVAARTAELVEANERLEAEIAERRQAEQRAQHLADHDALTGLPNRRLLEDRLTQALAQSGRAQRSTAVMFIDLDRFKTVNDSLGHAVGDTLLIKIARRLVDLMRFGDTVCRIGGDEFVLVLQDIKRTSDAAQVAQKVIDRLSAPINSEGQDFTITPSIGISIFPDDGRDAEALIRNADAAMYHAKEMGRANFQFFTSEMNLAASRRLTLENDLRRALQKDELRVYYQPIADIRTRRIVGHEALVRWQHPTRGLVPPVEFIQLAEETGLILAIGTWVLRTACRWATFIGIEHGLPVAVNLSARQFNDPRLVEIVATALKESGLPAALLELEITESTAMQHTDETLATLKALKDLGVSLVIDDFGSGYSSLLYLKRFPVDKLKIDGSFIAEVPGDPDHSAIVAAIIALGHALGLAVVAEGIENEAQIEFLRSYDCGFMQGNVIGVAVDADTAARDFI
ncbi:MAG: PAS domain S-box protein [Betaproteobacteria bacterium]|nr:PAS domain S-box protein [Betaproteobacteria bacterium]